MILGKTCLQGFSLFQQSFAPFQWYNSKILATLENKQNKTTYMVSSICLEELKQPDSQSPEKELES
jgi:hypothetical protein